MALNKVSVFIVTNSGDTPVTKPPQKERKPDRKNGATRKKQRVFQPVITGVKRARNEVKVVLVTVRVPKPCALPITTL